MREKLETLPLAQLREIARENGIKGITALRKANLIDLLVEIYEEKAKKNVVSKENDSVGLAADDEKTVSAGSAAVSENLTVNEESKRDGAEESTQGTVRRTYNTYNAQGEYRRPGTNAPQRRPVYGQRQAYRGEGSQPSYRSESGQQSYRSEGGQQSYRSEGGQSSYRSEGSQPSYRSEWGQQSYRSENGQSYRAEGSQPSYRSEGGQSSYRAEGSAQPSYRPENTQETAAVRPGNIPTEGLNTGIPDNRGIDIQSLDSGSPANGILEVMPDGFGFIRCANYMPGDDDVYVAPSQIRRFNLKTGDIIYGAKRIKSNTEKFAALLYITTVNGESPYVAEKRPNFEDLVPIFPDERLRLSGYNSPVSLRITDLLSPIGKGQRGMIVSQPKAGKTTLLKQIAKSLKANFPDMYVIILLIDERPEEVTDMKDDIEGGNVEVIYSTFDELPEHHRRVSEMVLERAKRLVEHGKDVTILLDSITRLARAYNLLVESSGRTLSGGLDPAALHMPKRFFGAARNMRNGGSLTILATALVETGSRMDDVVFEEFKGTGNMELVLNRKLSEKRIFPAIDIQRSGTRRDDLLLTPREMAAVDIIHKMIGDSKNEDKVEDVLNMFKFTKSNDELVEMVLKQKN